MRSIECDIKCQKVVLVFYSFRIFKGFRKVFYVMWQWRWFFIENINDHQMFIITEYREFITLARVHLSSPLFKTRPAKNIICIPSKEGMEWEICAMFSFLIVSFRINPSRFLSLHTQRNNWLAPMNEFNSRKTDSPNRIYASANLLLYAFQIRNSIYYLYIARISSIKRKNKNGSVSGFSMIYMRRIKGRE